MSIEIREETASDIAAIRTIVEIAFRDMPYADGDEQDVVDRLRSARALSLSLVATIDEEIVGHIAFSPAAQIGDASQLWFALGPVAVLPEHQRRGIGSELIMKGLAEIHVRRALGCILTGNPEYYRRFGFELSPKHVPDNEPAEFFMLKLFTATNPASAFRFHAAFYGDA
jgi:putative acetyltransferase